MDFGDILDKWEKQHTGGLPPEQNNSGAEEPARVNPMDAWMRVNGIFDKDSCEDAGKKQSAAERRQRLRRKKPDAEIDIHGLTRDEAWAALERFFGESKEKEFEKILVIHGKGNHSSGEAVLKRLVQEFVERCPFAGECGQGKAAAGGEGATWVLLKTESTAPGK